VNIPTAKILKNMAIVSPRPEGFHTAARLRI
jgi:hypothetical protein